MTFCWVGSYYFLFSFCWLFCSDGSSSSDGVSCTGIRCIKRDRELGWEQGLLVTVTRYSKWILGTKLPQCLGTLLQWCLATRVILATLKYERSSIPKYYSRGRHHFSLILHTPSLTLWVSQGADGHAAPCCNSRCFTGSATSASPQTQQTLAVGSSGLGD